MMTELMKHLHEKFGDAFFEEEIRNDFLVTTERKKLWAVQLDMLQRFVEICDSYDLRYFAIFGTLLGAVRHKGYVPWDDDIDVAMPRADFERFLSICTKEKLFSFPHFLQTPYTNKSCSLSYVQIRNSETSHFSPKFMREEMEDNMNLGIWIDVFVLDEVPSKESKAIYEAAMSFGKSCSAFMKKHACKKNLREYDFKQIEEYYLEGVSNTELWEKTNAVARTYEGSVDADALSIFTCIPYPWPKQVWSKESFSECIELPYEMLKLRVPTQYDEILSVTYKDWRQFPSMEERGAIHSGLILDPDVPYKEMLRKLL